MDGQNSKQVATGKCSDITILISDKIIFILKLNRRDKEEHLILIKETVNQEDIYNTYMHSMCSLVHPISWKNTTGYKDTD